MTIISHIFQRKVPYNYIWLLGIIMNQNFRI
jgi:hypothetical protein